MSSRVYTLCTRAAQEALVTPRLGFLDSLNALMGICLYYKKENAMRLIGLDIGDRTIGVAVSDPLGLTAQGITTIRRKSIQYDMQELKKIFDEYSPTKLICGLPKHMNGTIGEQGQKAIEYSEKLKEEFDIEIEMWDERLTSKAAHRIMIEADFSRKKRKGLVDKIAATYILQGYLDKIR